MTALFVFIWGAYCFIIFIPSALLLLYSHCVFLYPNFPQKFRLSTPFITHSWESQHPQGGATTAIATLLRSSKNAAVDGSCVILHF